jgi:hypothetical protein
VTYKLDSPDRSQLQGAPSTGAAEAALLLSLAALKNPRFPLAACQAPQPQPVAFAPDQFSPSPARHRNPDRISSSG